MAVCLLAVVSVSDGQGVERSTWVCCFQTRVEDEMPDLLLRQQNYNAISAHTGDPAGCGSPFSAFRNHPDEMCFSARTPCGVKLKQVDA